MTVLEAVHQGIVLPSIYADQLDLGREWLDRILGQMELVEKTGCWLWSGAMSKGYGIVHIRKLGKGGMFLVPRLCFGLANGPISEELHTHHVVEEPVGCLGTACGNPEHLVSVTPKEHTDRSPNSIAFVYENRDTCSNGHPYTEASTRVTNGRRHCRICEARWAQEARDRERGARPKGQWHDEFRKKECEHGHPYLGNNVQWDVRDGKVYRSCRECRRANQRAYTKRKAETLTPEQLEAKRAAQLAATKRYNASHREEVLRKKRERHAKEREIREEEKVQRIQDMVSSGMSPREIAEKLIKR